MTGDENSFFGVSTGEANTVGIQNSFFGTISGLKNVDGDSNSFFGAYSGLNNSSGNNNVFIGRSAGDFNTTGSNNTTIGSNADVGQPNLTHATAIGADSAVALSNTIALGRTDGSDRTLIWGLLDLALLDTAGSQAICRNANGRISTCSSSLRYKTNINPFGFGLNLVKSLKPITFDWKAGGMHDLGLGAEDVAAIEPLLVTYHKDGQVEGVKYDRIGVVLINAVKEQQAQIEAQQKQIEQQRASLQQQQSVIDGLKQIACAQNPKAAVCQ